jgi:hypothetical protein
VVGPAGLALLDEGHPPQPAEERVRRFLAGQGGQHVAVQPAGQGAIQRDLALF